MIKLGPVMQKALNKEFPNNWIAICLMLSLKYEVDEATGEITIFMDEETGDEITINNANEVQMNTPVDPETITHIIINATQKQET